MKESSQEFLRRLNKLATRATVLDTLTHTIAVNKHCIEVTMPVLNRQQIALLLTCSAFVRGVITLEELYEFDGVIESAQSACNSALNSERATTKRLADQIKASGNVAF